MLLDSADVAVAVASAVTARVVVAFLFRVWERAVFAAAVLKENTMKEAAGNRMYRARKKVGPRLRECCRQSQAEVVSKDRSKIHQTWGPPFSRALYRLTQKVSELGWVD